jgi:hypothetical protein
MLAQIILPSLLLLCPRSRTPDLRTFSSSQRREGTWLGICRRSLWLQRSPGGWSSDSSRPRGTRPHVRGPPKVRNHRGFRAAGNEYACYAIWAQTYDSVVELFQLGKVIVEADEVCHNCSRLGSDSCAVVTLARQLEEILRAGIVATKGLSGWQEARHEGRDGWL